MEEKLDTHYICETPSENSYNARVYYTNVYTGSAIVSIARTVPICTETLSAEPCAKNCVTFSEYRLRLRLETVNEV